MRMLILSIAFLAAVAMAMFPPLAIAQEVITSVSSDEVCATPGASIAAGIASLIAVASMAANFFKKDSFIGKVLNFVALNFKVKKA